MSTGQTFASDDPYKREVQRQWDHDPCGSQYAKATQPNTLEWYLEIERYRYGTYAPWMPQVMEFDRHRGKKLLEVGAGMGTDHAQYARHGALTTDLDLSAGHLAHAKRNFALRGLTGEFVHGDAENMPFADGTFDVVYSNGVIHHSPNTRRIVDEMYRVLKPGGRVIVMVYAENSLHYWRNLFYSLGIEQGRLDRHSMGWIMSESVELSEHGARPLVKVYTRRRLHALFGRFVDRRILQRQMLPEERPRWLRKVPVGVLQRFLGWNLVIKATKPMKL
jgi:ubiquinone/menaquinone biosynthesis C-methylase UbiE